MPGKTLAMASGATMADSPSNSCPSNLASVLGACRFMPEGSSGTPSTSLSWRATDARRMMVASGSCRRGAAEVEVVVVVVVAPPGVPPWDCGDDTADAGRAAPAGTSVREVSAESALASLRLRSRGVGFALESSTRAPTWDKPADALPRPGTPACRDRPASVAPAAAVVPAAMVDAPSVPCVADSAMSDSTATPGLRGTGAAAAPLAAPPAPPAPPPASRSLAKRCRRSWRCRSSTLRSRSLSASMAAMERLPSWNTMGAPPRSRSASGPPTTSESMLASAGWWGRITAPGPDSCTLMKSSASLGLANGFVSISTRCAASMIRSSGFTCQSSRKAAASPSEMRAAAIFFAMRSSAAAMSLCAFWFSTLLGTSARSTRMR
mmetsp:Transcript_4646/g.19796  ORF Transcript_4646/g.19796 Transcript_4646/m.19796 type:complete len:379 (-) Transcript_4646:78-1214(-)